MSNLTPDEEYEHVNANVMEDQLDVAVSCLLYTSPSQRD